MRPTLDVGHTRTVAADDRIPVLVYDDGSPGGVIAFDRALDVAARIVVAMTPASPNHTRNVAAADHAGTPVHVVVLGAGDDVHDAICRCADESIHLAFVPRPAEHPGRYVRRIVQAAGECQQAGHGVLAVSVVHPDATVTGPVVELDPAHSDSGFAALFAAGLAGTLGRPLHILRLPGDRTNAPVRDPQALDRARRFITDHDVAAFDEDVDGDPIVTARYHADGASSVVLALGGFTVHGRKPTAPSEIPDAVLRTPDGEIAHSLVADAPADIVLVLDAIHLEHGHVARSAAIGAAVGAITVGVLARGAAGLVAAGSGVGVAILAYQAVHHHLDRLDESGAAGGVAAQGA
ncbi:MAG: hypothetical protein RIB65_06850 [Ilumatobacter fluminis]|uniref:hypothetical protein n=1 Tax=Ilumatobacter fluminis TaxID=467091 RepID=UPI0032EEAF1F